MVHGRGWLDKWNIAFEPKYHIYGHVIMIWVFALFGIAMYNEYLAKESSKRKTGIPRPASSSTA